MSPEVINLVDIWTSASDHLGTIYGFRAWSFRASVQCNRRVALDQRRVLEPRGYDLHCMRALHLYWILSDAASAAGTRDEKSTSFSDFHSTLALALSSDFLF